jgi:hypothetical protein
VASNLKLNTQKEQKNLLFCFKANILKQKRKLKLFIHFKVNILKQIEANILKQIEANEANTRGVRKYETSEYQANKIQIRCNSLRSE